MLARKTFPEEVNPPLSALPPWRVLLAIWGCVGVGLAIETLGQLPGAPDLVPAWAIVQQFLRAAFWAAMTRPVLRWRQRWPLKGPRRYGHLMLHLMFSVILMVAFLLARFPGFLWIRGIRLSDMTWDFFLAGVRLRNVIDMLFYWSIFVGGWIFDLICREHEHQVSAAELKSRLTEAELAALRQQVQPHFLFNALSAIGALVRFGRKEEAVHGLVGLSEIHRTLLDSAGVATVTLEQELAFVERYLAIEKLRFGDRLQVIYAVDPTARPLPVPNLILQPIVENAVKHGVACRAGPSRVLITVRRGQDSVLITVCNDRPDEKASPTGGTGFGLRGVRQRLERLHGDRARLDFDFYAAAGPTATLKLPVQYEVSRETNPLPHR